MAKSYCPVGILVAGVPNETKSAGSAGIAILDDDLQWKSITHCNTITKSALRWKHAEQTYCFLDSTKLLEFGPKSHIISVPGKAPAQMLAMSLQYKIKIAARMGQCGTSPNVQLTIVREDIMR